ncbi:Response regulator receiver domain-containing protein [Ekhidna lutea]|uniref:Response regulator receiver domain-containing protein n=1 Tax=Ekhidna lutea TaxID=447679 RepID=A0A239HXH9_EKHLU|nr:response regulator [Ekhidna lutea]SNS86126.1 Response regulator receiver domain-containing protein [Ekhidna lutea]
MKEKLDRILLVDDDDSTNFLHKTILGRLDCANHIDVCQNGKEAIEFLSAKVDGEYPQPNVIFLDINMPIMNGWEFLEAYEKLIPEQKGDLIIAMVTTSTNPADRQKAQDFNFVSTFMNKPMRKDNIRELLKAHFPNLF